MNDLDADPYAGEAGEHLDPFVVAQKHVLSMYDPCFRTPGDETSFCVGCHFFMEKESFVMPGLDDGAAPATNFYVEESDSDYGPAYDALLLFAGLRA